MFDGNGLDRNALRQMWRGRERYSASWKCFRWRNITHLVFTTVRQPKPRTKVGKLPNWGWKMHKITNRRINKNRKKKSKTAERTNKRTKPKFYNLYAEQNADFLLISVTHMYSRTHTDTFGVFSWWAAQSRASPFDWLKNEMLSQFITIV